jgi:hypothetical protein
MTTLLLGLRNRSGGPRWLGIAMLALLAGTFIWLAMQAWPVLQTAQLPDKPADADRTDADRLGEFAANLDRFKAQVDGRSLFYIPPRPPPPRIDPVVDNTPREAPKPTRYGGPSIIAMVNGAVMFSDGQRVKIGESGRNVKVVSISAPWSARLEWQGVEFDVELFQRDSAVVRTSHASSEPSVLTPAPERRPAPAPPSAPPAASPPSASPAAPPPAEPASDPEPEPEPEPEPDPEPEPTEPASPSNPEPTPEPSDPEST